MAGVLNVQMDVFSYAGDIMKYDFNFIERGHLIKILESYKEITSTFDDMGFFARLEEDYDQETTERMVDYYVNKLNKKSSEVDVEDIDLHVGGKEDE